MSKDELIARLAEVGHRNGQIRGFETLTTPKLNKKSRATGEPFVGVVTIHKTFSGMVGVNFTNAVNNQQERDGKERDFVAQKPFGKHYVGDSTWLMQSDTDEHKFYIAVDAVGGSKSEYLRDGKPMTEDEVADLKANFLPTPSKSKIAGNWRTYGVESIIKVS